MDRRSAQLLSLFALFAMLLPLRAFADMAVPDQYRNVGVDEHPNAQVPLDLTFYDDRGQVVKLGDYFNSGRPVIMQLGYYQCPKLCDVVSRGLVDSAKDIDLKAGTDFDFVFVSISPGESPNLAALKRQSFIVEYGHPDQASGFHCLVGTQSNITPLAQTMGFRYKAVDIDGQFAHPAVLFVLTPQGKISRYLYGVTYPSRTLHLALVEASAGKIGTSFDRLALMICCYDVATGKYAVTATFLMEFGAIATLFAMGGFFWWLIRHTPRYPDAPPGTLAAR
jgi:protein SCO1/2